MVPLCGKALKLFHALGNFIFSKALTTNEKTEAQGRYAGQWKIPVTCSLSVLPYPRYNCCVCDNVSNGLGHQALYKNHSCNKGRGGPLFALHVVSQ